MLRLRAWTRGWAGALIIAALITTPCRAAQPAQTDSTPLIKLAASKFPDLTKAERAMLRFMDVDNTDRGEWAFCGPSAALSDPSNDPKDARNWTHDRDIRASLIRWLTVYHPASDLVDPKGIRILGARIVGPLDLSHVRVPFAIAMVECSIPETINLNSTEIPHLDLAGSYTAGIYARNLNVSGELDLGSDNILRTSQGDRGWRRNAGMRRTDHQQSVMFRYISAERRVPKDHPLRSIRPMVDVALRELAPRLDAIYARYVPVRRSNVRLILR